jgi:hypothetical protein
MRIAIEFALIVTIIVTSFPLPLINLIVLAVASIALWLFTTNNSFNDGYEAAIEDRVY